jgi:hypothetical protein
MIQNQDRNFSRSEDVPRAVEYLIQLVLRWTLWTMAFGFGIGALVCLSERWSSYITIPLVVLFVLTAIAGWAVKSSSGRLVVGPSVRDIGIVVPRLDSSAETAPPKHPE